MAVRIPADICLKAAGTPKAASPLSNGFWSTQSLPASPYLYMRKIKRGRKVGRETGGKRGGEEVWGGNEIKEGAEVKGCGRTRKTVKERTGKEEGAWRRGKGGRVEAEVMEEPGTGTGKLLVRGNAGRAPSPQPAPSWASSVTDVCRCQTNRGSDN